MLTRLALCFMYSIYIRALYRAGDETRTRDPQLGRLMLYQLSYARLYGFVCQAAFSPALKTQNRGGDRIRTYSGVANRFTVCPVSPTSAHPHFSKNKPFGFLNLQSGYPASLHVLRARTPPAKFLLKRSRENLAGLIIPLFEPAEGLFRFAPCTSCSNPSR